MLDVFLSSARDLFTIAALDPGVLNGDSVGIYSLKCQSAALPYQGNCRAAQLKPG